MSERITPIQLNIPQQGEAWHRWRSGGVGGSDISRLIFGDTADRDALIAEKFGKHKREFTPFQVEAMARGHRLEPEARAEFIRYSGVEIEPTCFTTVEYPQMRVSLDGYADTVEGGLVVEIKCLSNTRHEKLFTDGIPKEYRAQIEYQLLVSGASVGIFWAYNPDSIRPIYTQTIYCNDFDRSKYIGAIQQISPYWRNQVPHVIALTGEAQSGKDTTAAVLAENYGYRRFALADELKREAVEGGILPANYFELPYEEQEQVKREKRDELVELGRYRRSLDVNYWVDRLFENIDFGSGRVVITDARYLNERLEIRRRVMEMGYSFEFVSIERLGNSPKGEEHLSLPLARCFPNYLNLYNRGQVLEELQQHVIEVIGGGNNA